MYVSIPEQDIITSVIIVNIDHKHPWQTKVAELRQAALRKHALPRCCCQGQATYVKLFKATAGCQLCAKLAVPLNEGGGSMVDMRGKVAHVHNL